MAGQIFIIGQTNFVTFHFDFDIQAAILASGAGMGATDLSSILSTDDLNSLAKSVLIGSDDLIEPGAGIADIGSFFAGKWFWEWVSLHCSEGCWWNW